MATKYKLGSKNNPIKRFIKRTSTDNDLNLKIALTRYCYETGWRNATGPRGGKALMEFARGVWYADGKFYSVKRKSIKHEDGSLTFINELHPITGIIRDIHGNQSRDTGIPVVNLNCKDGVPIEVEMDNEWMVIGLGWPLLEDMLYLDDKRIPRWTKEKNYAA